MDPKHELSKGVRGSGMNESRKYNRISTGALHDWLRVITGSGGLLSFQGTAPRMGGFKGDVSFLISKLKALNWPGGRGWAEGMRTSFDHSASAQAMDLCQFSCIHCD